MKFSKAVNAWAIDFGKHPSPYHGRYSLSVYPRWRGGRFSYEHYKGCPISNHEFYSIGWASPNRHAWWARTIFLHIYR